MKTWFTVIVVVACIAGGGWWLREKKSGDKTASAKSSRPTSAMAESRDINFSINAAGEIGPADQVSVRPEVNGRILQLPVDIGDSVRKGEVLFQLDDRDLQIEKESQQKEIERAKLEIEQAERNYMRSKALFEENLISKELFEDTKTQYELAKNTLGRAEKTMELVDDRLRKTRILAPFDCTVLTRPVSVGQAVSGSGGFNSGTEVLTIANLTDMIINAHINQADVARLSPKQEVNVHVEAVAGLRMIGKVERIAPQATIKNNIKGFAVRILLQNVDPRVRPGMTANIQIPVAAAEDVVAVPLAAVFTERNPGTQETERFVYVSKNKRFERRPVQIGVSDYFYAEVTKGLSSGETVSLEQPPKDKIDVPEVEATDKPSEKQDTKRQASSAAS
ncbi:MAG TPA: efflux RND transporter periplasmic adaptor subunit [Verrucomicrobiae bacterium]|nr:efflux RND transporter periplasmic adaptor subunit [Verrucomicrobiae bacterium]